MKPLRPYQKEVLRMLCTEAGPDGWVLIEPALPAQTVSALSKIGLVETRGSEIRIAPIARQLSKLGIARPASEGTRA